MKIKREQNDACISYAEREEHRMKCNMKIKRGQPLGEIRQIGNLTEGAKRANPQRRRLYDPDGIAPTMYNYGAGGNLVPLMMIEYDTED